VRKVLSALYFGIGSFLVLAWPAHAMAKLSATIETLLNMATGLGLLVCAFFICVAGYYFMTSGGNPSAIERSKSAAFNAAIGFALVLAARVVANVIQSAIVT
jgi:Type IV secretion system pilin